MGKIATPAIYTLTTPVGAIPGVGPAMKEKLARLGIRRGRDLLLHWPRSWQDLTRPTPIALVRRDSTAVVRGTLHSICLERGKGRRKLRVTATVRDQVGDELPVVWFNQAFLAKALREGQSVVLVGQVVWNWQERRLVLSSPRIERDEAIVPVYPETAGLTSKTIRNIIAPFVNNVEISDVVGARDGYDLTMSVRIMHAPKDMESIPSARQRLAFDELCALQYEVLRRRHELERLPAPEISLDLERVRSIVGHLPFRLNDAQRRASWQIMQDLTRAYPMSRLLLGDVGSGKTVVAAVVAVPVLAAGQNVAWMAPTQVLAMQLAARLHAMLVPGGYAVKCVLGGDVIEKTEEPTLFVGTQALANHDLNPLGLVIIDEQHRFGVRQRSALIRGAELLPHVLTMSATPIPRSLALTLYGDLDITALPAQAAHRAGVETIRVTTGEKTKVFDVCSEVIAKGQQVFVVVPRIQRTENGLPSIQDVADGYRQAIPRAKIAIYHGQQSSKDREKILAEFIAGDLDLIVATTIIEVGIDIPNATIMVVEEADSYGLAQLHQLRGRVGRGMHRGRCYLISDEPGSVAVERLRALEEYHDGLALAELDLAQRGPGELLGVRQAGLPQLRLASLTDVGMLEQARSIVGNWLEQPPSGLQQWLALYRTMDDV